jgi:RHS repeat-associated protein
VAAIVTRGGDTPGAVYVHVDHIGSVEKLTNEKGGVVEKRSYDPYGQRRNHVWGQPPPASFASKITLGFTSHESDDEVGLVNMRGRVYDPKVGRFLTTDPIVSNLYSGQSFNAYSYVVNNPLTLVDPSGFQPAMGVISQPGYPDVPLHYEEIKGGYGNQVARYLNHEGPPPREEPPPGPKEKEDARQAGEVGAAAPPTDVDTTGSSPELDPQAATTTPEDLTQNPYVQVEGGFLAGVSLGLVPMGGVGHQLLDAGEVLPHGTPEARLGLSVGLIVGGIATTAGGLGGEVLGGAATTTGIGAAVGVPAIVVSTTLVVGGAGNIAAGIRGLTQSLSKGSGTPPAAKPASEFPRSSLRGASIKWLNKNKPQGWTKTPTRDNQGWIWRDENGVERLRFMRPNGENPGASQWSRQANGYFRWKDANGNYLDIDGNVLRQGVEGFEEASHIMYEGSL